MQEAPLAAFNWVCDNFLRRAKEEENEPSGADKLYLIHIICEKVCFFFSFHEFCARSFLINKQGALLYLITLQQHNHSRGGAVVMDTYSDLCEARDVVLKIFWLQCSAHAGRAVSY